MNTMIEYGGKKYKIVKVDKFSHEGSSLLQSFCWVGDKTIGNEDIIAILKEVTD